MSIYHGVSIFRAWQGDKFNSFLFFFSAYFLILGLIFMAKAKVAIFAGQSLSSSIKKSRYWYCTCTVHYKALIRLRSFHKCGYIYYTTLPVHLCTFCTETYSTIWSIMRAKS